MPSPGRKRTPAAVKAARGTVQKSRAQGETVVEQLARDTAPAMSIVPPPLPDAAAEVWADYVHAAIANGARQCDADSFAEWCTMAALLRAARNTTVEDEDGREISKPAPAPASYVAQWRMLGELFGLAGPGSRLIKGGGEKPKTENPFARNGRR